MKNWFSHLFSPSHPAETAQPAAYDFLMLQNELQSLRLELDSRDQTIADLKQQIERQRARQAEVIEETASARLERLFADVAAPVSQILTQADLLENQGKPLQAGDVLTVARRMIRALERHGLTIDSQPGQLSAYDPDRHVPLDAGRTPQPGDPVTVRFAGVTYQGKTLYKAVVE